MCCWQNLCLCLTWAHVQDKKRVRARALRSRAKCPGFRSGKSGHPRLGASPESVLLSKSSQTTSTVIFRFEHLL